MMEHMPKLLAVAAGGGVGSMLRFLLSHISHKAFGNAFPWGTLTVNMLGAFLVGLLFGISDRIEMPHLIRLFIFIGILGGFTTFSAFALENYNLIRSGQYESAMTNIVLQNVLALVLLFVGMSASRLLMKA